MLIKVKSMLIEIKFSFATIIVINETIMIILNKSIFFLKIKSKLFK